MTERDRIPRTSDPTPPSDPERERAQAVHSVDDETRVHADADETDLVQDAGGQLRRPEAEDRGGEEPADEGDDTRRGETEEGGGEN